MTLHSPLPASCPNALIASQVARLLDVAPQSVAQAIAQGRLESFEYMGVTMVPVRSVRRWQRRLAKQRAKDAAALAKFKAGIRRMMARPDHRVA